MTISSTLAKMSRGEPVSMDVLMRLCDYLDCNIGEIMSFVKGGGTQVKYDNHFLFLKTYIGGFAKKYC